MTNTEQVAGPDTSADVMPSAASADGERLKVQGNDLFQAGDFLKAAAVYTQAIKLDPENAVLYR
jgi:Flp pilus assembly protein TadD